MAATQKNTSTLLIVNADPRISGVSAPIGSTARSSVDGSIYQKTGALSTAWTLIPAGGANLVARAYLNTHNNGTAFAVTSLTRVGLVATATVSTANGRRLVNGQTVVISGASPAAYNGTFVITKATATTFTYTMLSVPPTSPATGTIGFLPLLIQGQTNVTAASKTATGDGTMSFTNPGGTFTYSCNMTGGVDQTGAFTGANLRDSVITTKANGVVYFNQFTFTLGAAADSCILDVVIST